MSSVQPTDFPRFLELPFEIRWTIYDLCLPIRVIDGEIPDLRFGLEGTMTREEGMALRYIVAKFSRTPVIARASPEVDRKLQRHVAGPPDSEWVWSWLGHEHEGFTDGRPIIFDTMSDILYISPTRWNWGHDRQDYLDGGSPSCLSKNKHAVLAIEEECIVSGLMWPRLLRQCLLGRKACVVILNETRLIKPAEWIASCGLFGLFGEERTVLVDVHDFKRIDYYDRKLNGQGLIVGDTFLGEEPVAPGGIR